MRLGQVWRPSAGRDRQNRALRLFRQRAIPYT
jgi:hypothetical protein